MFFLMALSKSTQIPVGIDIVSMGWGVGLLEGLVVGSVVGKAKHLMIQWLRH